MRQTKAIPQRARAPQNPLKARRNRALDRQVAAMSPEEARALAYQVFDVEGAKQACRQLPAHIPFIYIPWIASHGDALLELINGTEPLCAPIPLVPNVREPRARHRASGNVRRRPDAFLPLCEEVLRELPSHVRGVIFSHDWTPVMRQTAYVCKRLGLETILIPHEGIFARADAYYRDLNNGAGYPVCDRVLAWGDLQAEIFTSRGYPRERIFLTGAPKFDLALSYQPQSSRAEFCARLGLSTERPVVLFALQPLDSQYDRARAKASQRKAVRHLAATCLKRGFQLVLRGPPSGDDVLGLHKWLRWLPGIVLDPGSPYLVPAAEAIYHSALILAVNSTMLFEAAVMGRPSIAVPGAEAEAAWQLIGGPVISLDASFGRRAAQLIDGGRPSLPTDPGSACARALSAGRFDAQAVPRIRALLSDPSHQARTLDFSDYSFLFDEHVTPGARAAPGTLGFHRSARGSMAHVPAMLGFHDFTVPRTLHDAARVDVFARWSGVDARNPRRIDDYAATLRRPRLILEDGLVRSIGLGIEGTPGLSVIIDDIAPYYDATQPTRLEATLSGDWELTLAQRARSESAISRITSLRIAKYNHASDFDLELPKDSVLVVDQRAGDRSIQLGLGSPEAFSSMLQAAVRENPGRSIIVKLHPDAISGLRESSVAQFLSDEFRHSGDIRVIERDVNPHALLDACSLVYTVTSGMGFEALMRGREVRCFGMPFYAGWGLTEDTLTCPRRARPRTLLDVFHAAYIVHSRYYSPSLGRACDLEELLDYLASMRQSVASDPGAVPPPP